MKDTSNIFVEIALEIGVEAADKLESGEPLEGSLAWRVMDLLASRHRHTVIYEDEEVDGGVECYVIAMEIDGGYVFYLAKKGDSSLCWMSSSGSEVSKNIRRLEALLDECTG
ncbi:hypothetical protein [Desulfurococcus mucosus]|uniref:Uncharacterized protein n=1 Tax=Desulfurococcus mucosus (strain ATCC 35584 / DSM 2162 / JCM 9187 / O7/1) TaxID=765177 RepID=E8RA22_DESM0|nr:hypothetical protein [Desulfurococcus mucosus]ADV65348.1 hypothetical protein Desmu_1046 [Desulfurococcus mucosus DSM 2162]